MTKVPILTYHANNINGMDYHNNDHIALEQDLKVINELGLQVISMDQLLDWRLGKAPDSSVENAVVLSCDDGTDFDYHDLNHPTHGLQTSFLNLLKAHHAATGRFVHMTNFVIVSPDARCELDERCLVGQGWWRDEWWQAAQQSGLMHIANHSWNHNHGIFDNQNVADDSFHHIDTKELCDQQIRQAQGYLQKMLGDAYQAKYFAYPYGNYSNFLRYEYLPLFGTDMQLIAAFTTVPQHVTKASKIWALPRFVCNNDWSDPTQLQQILV